VPRGPKGEKRPADAHRHGDHAAKMKFKEDRPFGTPDPAKPRRVQAACPWIVLS
jgi:hypothetical protein